MRRGAEYIPVLVNIRVVPPLPSAKLLMLVAIENKFSLTRLLAVFAPKKAVAEKLKQCYYHQWHSKCRHITHRQTISEEDGIMQKKPLQRSVAGALNSICNITTLL